MYLIYHQINIYVITFYKKIKLAFDTKYSFIIKSKLKHFMLVQTACSINDISLKYYSKTEFMIQVKIPLKTVLKINYSGVSFVIFSPLIGKRSRIGNFYLFSRTIPKIAICFLAVLINSPSLEKKYSLSKDAGSKLC